MHPHTIKREGMPMTDDNAKIRNCWAQARKELTCPMRWDSLSPTSNQNVRHCNACSRDVYFVETDEELGRAIREDRCIAMATPEKIRQQRRNFSQGMMLGRVSGGRNPITKLLNKVWEEDY